MTEDEAKKIIDWLCMRWAKKIQHLYKTEKSIDITVKMSDERWIVGFDNAFELVFKVVFFYAYEGKQIEKAFNYNSRLLYDDDQLLLKILKVKSRSKSQFADFLESIFNKNDIFVEGWNTHGVKVNFVDAGESLEEIKVKMDLEEIA